MIVVGIDPGIAITGYGFIRQLDHGELEAVEYGVIKTPSDVTLENRLLHLFEKIKSLLFLHQPQSGAVEKLYFQRNVRSAMIVGQARGVVMLALAEAGKPVTEYSPMEVKQAVTGYGNASKGQMQQMVRALLNLSEVPRPDDAADALAIAICHLHSSLISNLF